ncbi:hypothetical protein ACP275_13G193000 [Erythranthe tilingii]
MSFPTMAFTISAYLLVFFTSIITSIPMIIFTATVVEDLNNLQPPANFNSTITNNCLTNPSLRYCSTAAAAFDLREIFKFTIVASHLCNISKNPNCVESFPKIDLRSQPKLAPLYLSFTFFWKFCPLTVSSIDLSNNSLDGNFPIDILHCSQIEFLDLSRNNFSGDFPIQNFSVLENLTFLNLSYNDFSECRISEARFFERFNSTSFIHSGLIPNHKEFKIKAVLLLVGFPVLVIAMVVCWGWIICFRSKHNFTPSILESATNGFSRRNLVGKSKESSTYRGVLKDGREVRIEIYLGSNKMSRDERRRFVEQCKVLVRLQHENLVPVLGWCDSSRCRGIVTEWINGENVDTWLTNNAPPWKQRVKVILRVAAGICYLHQEWPHIGYNLKTKNIVLSEDGEPIITSFKIDDDHHSSKKKTCKFGIFMLEIVTNRRAVEEFEKKETGFVEWVKLNYSEHVENVIDKRMKKTAEIVAEAAEVIEFGLMCADISNRQQLKWDKIWDLLSKMASASRLASPDHHRTTPGLDRGRVHDKHVHHH